MTMQLERNWFDLMQEYGKNFELRLADEKRKQLKIGDQIQFVCKDTGRTFTRIVEDMQKFMDFEQFFREYPHQRLRLTRAQFLDLNNALQAFYTDDDISNNGVVAIFLQVDYKNRIEILQKKIAHYEKIVYDPQLVTNVIPDGTINFMSKFGEENDADVLLEYAREEIVQLNLNWLYETAETRTDLQNGMQFLFLDSELATQYFDKADSEGDTWGCLGKHYLYYYGSETVLRNFDKAVSYLLEGFKIETRFKDRTAPFPCLYRQSRWGVDASEDEEAKETALTTLRLAVGNLTAEYEREPTPLLAMILAYEMAQGDVFHFDEARLHELHTHSCSTNMPLALLYYGSYLAQKAQTEQEYLQAVEVLEQAGIQGSAEAYYIMTLIYYSSPIKNSKKHLYCMQRSAELGWAFAQHLLALWYLNELNDKNLSKEKAMTLNKHIIYWLKKAAEQGNQAAQELLDKITQ